MAENAVIELEGSDGKKRNYIEGDIAELDGATYHAFFPVDDEDGEVLIRKDCEGKQVMVNAGTDEYAKVSAMFLKRVSEQLLEEWSEEGIIELVDDEGNVQKFELVDTAELNGTMYFAVIPADDEDGDSFVILKQTKTDDRIPLSANCLLSTIDDDDEYNEVGEVFLKRFSELDDEE